jgi:tetratricopeptide (TPR) repeat protein
MVEFRRGVLVLVVLAAWGGWARSADLAEARQLLRSGKYQECIDAAAKAIEDRQWGEGWWVVKIQAEMASGQYGEAQKSYESALERYDGSVVLRMLGYDVLRYNNKPDEAREELATIRGLAERVPWRYTEAPSRIALGLAMLKSGVDARQVLELFYDKAKKDSPDSPEPYIASGELALEKSDYALAAESFAEALKRSPEDPEIHFGLARAYENDADRATAALNKALELNPRHVEALLFQADNLIDREDYAGAEAILRKVVEINPRHPRAWAYRAVLAHIAGERDKEEAHRAKALEAWATNPEVDWLIGLKLSQKYRFAEGAARQGQALTFDEDYRPAKVQLCQDLLRLGKEEEGWRLADAVFKEDPYNVVAFNLMTLHDNLSKFRTIQNEHFVLRMEPREADVYGERALRLLTLAKKKLCAKYGVELKDPVTVEIFPQQKDFAIRTFGLPGGAGYLGVCFGPVVTVNSPASRASHPSNWEAVLWHEFCHTVTLHKTHNKMPRWLSEGISVYEEMQEVGSWGQVMTPAYRELILEGGATPVSKLSGAFLKPPTPMHLQFAYFESSLVVRYVVEHFGAASLGRILDDLAKDVPINDALAKHTEPIDKLDENFAKWLKARAEALAPKAKWEHPELDLDAGSAEMAAWNKAHPDQFWGLLGEGRALVAERKWEAAKAPLRKAIELYPTYAEAGGPYLLLAAAHRELGETKAERELLEKHLALDADAVEPRIRLMEIATAAGDWRTVLKYGGEVLGINPLIASPHRLLARAAEETGERKLAIETHRTLLMLDPLDRAEHHYRLGRLLMEEKQLPAARREVVQSLEEAPRYRAAHRLLLEIVAKMEKPTTAPATTRPITTTQPATTRPVKPPTPEVQKP